ncbi:DUF3486 family protein [Alteriqipengyuania flavescens]|uniref:phage protein Gp27 family protein n=1 Tax=Alteriqipengyuania flavescens TaxID=3053610 RepID=UPI0025B28B98|nr:phage protein Gp27 family protein [Alteriqipengyuania flavescens]WJY18708.1 DUF3486 family protein [Alteriqipengyuania flavescens]WJY24648.1 DUF3486 family protein [Alteriqipengyuania flavescens]
MGGRSSIDQLPRALRDAVHAAIADGLTITEIRDMLEEEGADVSRSAVGRYTKQYSEVAARTRDMTGVARAFATEFGDAESPQVKLIVQLFTSLLTQAIMPMASGESGEIDAREVHFLARAFKDFTSASKTDTDRSAKEREEDRKRARQEAAENAEKAARGSGASPDTIAAIRKSILGID